MAAKWIEAITGSLEQKKQYRQDKARIEHLRPARTDSTTGSTSTGTGTTRSTTDSIEGDD